VWRRQYRQGLLGEGQETANLLPVNVTGMRLAKRIARAVGKNSTRNRENSGRD